MVCPILTLRSGILNEHFVGVQGHDRARCLCNIGRAVVMLEPVKAREEVDTG